MTTFQIATAEIAAFNKDKYWWWKALIAFFKRKPYDRLYYHKVSCRVDSNKKIKLNDIFVTGRERATPYRVVNKVGNHGIIAVGIRYSPERFPNIVGQCIVIKREHNESEA